MDLDSLLGLSDQRDDRKKRKEKKEKPKGKSGFGILKGRFSRKDTLEVPLPTDLSSTDRTLKPQASGPVKPIIGSKSVGVLEEHIPSVDHPIEEPRVRNKSLNVLKMKSKRASTPEMSHSEIKHTNDWVIPVHKSLNQTGILEYDLDSSQSSHNSVYSSTRHELKSNLQKLARTKALSENNPPEVSLKKLMDFVMNEPDPLLKISSQNATPYLSNLVQNKTEAAINKRIDKILSERKLVHVNSVLVLGDTPKLQSVLWDSVSSRMKDRGGGSFQTVFAQTVVKCLCDICISIMEQRITLDGDIEKIVRNLLANRNEPLKISLSDLETLWKLPAVKLIAKEVLTFDPQREIYFYLLDGIHEWGNVEHFKPTENHKKYLHALSLGPVRDVKITLNQENQYIFRKTDKLRGSMRYWLDALAGPHEVLIFFSNILTNESRSESYCDWQLTTKRVHISPNTIIFLVFQGKYQSAEDYFWESDLSKIKNLTMYSEINKFAQLVESKWMVITTLPEHIPTGHDFLQSILEVCQKINIQRENDRLVNIASGQAE